MRRPIRDRIQLSTIDSGDSVGPAHPKIIFTIFQQFVNSVAGQSLTGGVVGEFSRSPAIQSGSARSEPESAVGVFMNGPDFFILKRFGRSVTYKVVAMQSAYTVIGPN